MKVFVYSARPYDQSVLQEVCGSHELVFTERKLSLGTAHLAAGCEAVALFTSDDASSEVLERLHALGVRNIVLRSVGYDHVDLKMVALLGMRVANVPEYSPYAVAEHGVALLMALNRKLILSQQLMALQDFRINFLKGVDIHGKVVGVVGTGKIGLAFSRIMVGFGARVLGFDPHPSEEAMRIGVAYTSFETLLKTSDVISLHCPLTPDTKHLLSAAQFSAMKEGCILINTGRGALINTSDLIMSLESGRLGGVGLDVYEFEKTLFFEDHQNDIIQDEVFIRLRSFKNVLITGHQGFLTEEAVRQIAQTTIANLDCFEGNLPCPNALAAPK